MNANPQPNAQPQLAQISAAAFAAKFQSKRGKWHYIPPQESKSLQVLFFRSLPIPFFRGEGVPAQL